MNTRQSTASRHRPNRTSIMMVQSERKAFGTREIEDHVGGESKENMRTRRRLLGLVLEEGDEVVSVLGLLETTEGHLGTGDVLLGVLEVLELGQVSCELPGAFNGYTYQSLVAPLNTLLLVGVGV